MATVTKQDTHDRGLAFDLATMARLPTVLDRRGAMKAIAGLGVLVLGACASKSDTAAQSSTATTVTTATTPPTSPSAAAAATATTSCATIPEETAGPFPGDGSNGPNALTQTGVVHQDITSSFGSSTTKAVGVPLTINFVVLENANGCKPLAGAAVYVWHCDSDGNYSMYSSAAKNENYLRGVQQSDSNGRVSFTSIFPGCYPGRWPHIHFEVYPSMASATSSRRAQATSQIALPEAACKEVYATAGYEASVRSLSRVSLTRDNVFADDGAVRQLATMSGRAGSRLTAELSVAV